jgi:hypothetical protein
MGLFKLKLKRDFVTSKKKHLLLEGDEVVLKDVTEHFGNMGSSYSSTHFEVYSLTNRKYLGNIDRLEIEDIEDIEDVKKKYSEEDMKSFGDWCRNALPNTDYSFKKLDEHLKTWEQIKNK